MQEDYPKEKWQKRKTRRLPNICCIYVQQMCMGQSSSLYFLSVFHRAVRLACFHPCLTSVVFTGPSLLEMKFCKAIFPQSEVDVSFWKVQSCLQNKLRQRQHENVFLSRCTCIFPNILRLSPSYPKQMRGFETLIVVCKI